MKSPIVRGKLASSDMVNGSMPRSSSSRATRMANPSESKPVSCRDRSSSSGGRVTCCSTAICCIAEIILNLVDMDCFAFSLNCENGMIERKYETIRSCPDLSRPLVNTMTAVKPRFREIQESDVEAIADLLTRGFVHRSREYWIRGLRRQSARSLPPDAPRYGYLMENDGKPAGCLLLIYSTKIIDGRAAICCNNSSWYVDPEFRNYAALFASMTQKRRDATYFNVTAAPPTGP